MDSGYIQELENILQVWVQGRIGNGQDKKREYMPDDFFGEKNDDGDEDDGYCKYKDK